MIAEKIQERESRDHDYKSEPTNRRSVIVPEPDRHLPWHARELSARFRAALQSRAANPTIDRRSAGRTPQERVLLVQHLSSACRNASVLARLSIARSLDAHLTTPGVVEGIAA